MAQRVRATEQETNGATKPPIKTAVTLSHDAHKRLKTAVLVEGKDQSEIVEGLITSQLQGYFSGRRGQGAKSEQGEDE